ncbi:tRNA methyltransferase ppm2 [Rhinocladiella similis]
MGAFEEASRAIDNGLKLEKNAGLLMATNNATIAFKANTERLYMPEPHFYKYFAKQPLQTSPAINRGYWLRMRSVEWVVRQFLEKPSGQRKVIINLGCGYDPMPFQWLAREKPLCSNTKFIDVDYELLMETKREIIFTRPEMKGLLHSVMASSSAICPEILIDSQEYSALGCDLRNLRKLDKLLTAVVDLEDSMVLCVAEDSTCFMRTDDANALIQWTSGLSRDVTFCAMEPRSPDQPDNAFTAKMTSYYAKQGTPLRSIFEYDGRHTQNQRFREAGFPSIEYQNLWELWADSRFLSPSQRMALDYVEPFDAWEEFALHASHHCLVVAHNQLNPFLPQRIISRRNSDASDASDISARTSSPNNPDSQLTAFHYYKAPGDLCERHHGSTYPIPGQDAIAVYGGQGPTSCRATSAVCRPRYLRDETPTVLPPEVGARCCHVCTAMNNGDNILVGGRALPDQPLRDCWLQKGNMWHRIHDLPEPRYRCRVVPVTLPDNLYGAVCLGGKTGPTKVATDILLWEPTRGWHVLRALINQPVPRFGPNFIRLGFNHGVFFGGMRQDGVICQDFWRWRLVIRDNVVVGISFRPSHALDASAGAYPWFSRFGASYGFVQDNLLIIGGIAKGGCIPKTYEMLSMTGSFSILHDEGKEFTLHVTSVEPTREPDCPRPILIGHSTHRTQTGMFVIIGGGVTCFHYGNYFNKGIWVLHDKEAGISADWIIVPTRPSILPGGGSEPSVNGGDHHQDGFLIKRALIKDQRDFQLTTRRLRPIIMPMLNFGACMRLWSMQYLRDHDCLQLPSELQTSTESEVDNTQSQDIKAILREHLQHSRIVSSDFYPHGLTPTAKALRPINLTDELPELASDFQLPAEMSSLKPLVNSTLFQISNGISTVPTYDVMATIIAQIRGAKKLVLFPPCDINEIGYAPGAVHSNMRVFSNTGSGQRYSLHPPPRTSPHLAVLKAGEALLIPPFWSYAHVPHFERSNAEKQASRKLNSEGVAARRLSYAGSDTSTSSLSSASEFTCESPKPSSRTPLEDKAVREQAPHLDIAVSITFRNLDSSAYAPSPTTTGNFSLIAYEEGRRDMEKVLERFTRHQNHSTNSMVSDSKVNGKADGGIALGTLPKDVTKALLERLGKELLSKAEAL